MLTVKTSLKLSAIPNAGIGLFAEEFIPKGTKIWEFTPGLDLKFTEEEYSKFNDLNTDFLFKYTYKCNGEYILCVDNGRFINHSDDANTDDSSSFFQTIAKKDIQAGEEITSNYNEFGRTAEDLEFNKPDY
ncbi:MAG: SET domain-containing protein [Bacteroidia bacterium]